MRRLIGVYGIRSNNGPVNIILKVYFNADIRKLILGKWVLIILNIWISLSKPISIIPQRHAITRLVEVSSGMTASRTDDADWKETDCEKT